MEIKNLSKNKIIDYLVKPVSAAPLLVFKIIFGAMMVLSTIRFIWLGWIEDHYLSPKFHFKYYGFEFVEPLPAHYLYAVHLLIIFSALGIALAGRWLYKLSAIVLFLGFTYTELIDLTYYLNHYYFVSCICFILILLPSKSGLLLFSNSTGQIPNWCLLILKFQISLVYVYAGLAKINYDWLVNALPLKIWLPAHDKIPIIGYLFTLKITPYLFSWAGMLYDCTIVLFLINKKTRLWSYLTVVFFHVLTGLLFQIGVFPLIMIGATLVFFDWKIFDNNALTEKIANIPKQNFRGFTACIVWIYCIFQLLFPLRYLFYSNNLLWAEQGYRFSWRVMLMEKAGTATFYVRNPITGKEGMVNNSEFLNLHQEKQMASQPDMILQFAHFLGKYYHDKFDAPDSLDYVRVEAFATLNGRPSKLMINPNINLMKEQDGFAPKKWITDFQEK